jgi:hypothetical protein
VTQNDDNVRNLQDRIEDHNRRAMRDDLSREDIADLKKLLAKQETLNKLADRYGEIDFGLKVQERVKWIVTSIAMGVPILAAIWQLFDRMSSKK